MRHILAFAGLLLLCGVVISANNEAGQQSIAIHEYYMFRGVDIGPIQYSNILHFTRSGNVLYETEYYKIGIDTGQYVGTWRINGDTLFIERDTAIESSFGDELLRSKYANIPADSNVCAMKIKDYGNYLLFYGSGDFDSKYFPKNYCLFSDPGPAGVRWCEYYFNPWIRVAAPSEMMNGEFKVVDRYMSSGKPYICTLRKDSIDFNIINPLLYRADSQLPCSDMEAMAIAEWMDTVIIGQSYYFNISRPKYPRKRRMEINEFSCEPESIYISTGDTSYLSRGDTLREAYGYFFAKLVKPE